MRALDDRLPLLTLFLALSMGLWGCDDAEADADPGSDADLQADASGLDAGLGAVDGAPSGDPRADAGPPDAAVPDGPPVDASLPDASAADAAAPFEFPDIAAEVDPWAENGWFQSAVFVLVAGDEVMVYAVGERSADDPTPPDMDTIYEIGSVSKTMTGYLLADAVERGAVEPDTPVQDLLDPALVRIPSWETDGGAEEITLVQLARHTSGLPRDLPFPEGERVFDGIEVEEMYAFLTDHNLRRPPGTVHEYSNLGAGLLGHALGVLDGHDTYDGILLERLAPAFGLDSTGVELLDDLAARVAPPHDDARVSTWPIDIGPLSGAGAVRSSPGDLVRYVQGLMRPADDAQAAIVGRALDAQDVGNFIRIGYHWFADEPFYMHNGRTIGYDAYVAFDPDRELAVIALANSTTWATGYVAARLRNLLSGEPPGLPEQALGDLEVSAELEEEISGDWQVDGADQVVTIGREDGVLRLRVDWTFGPALFLHAPNQFHIRPVQGGLSVNRNADGTVRSLTFVILGSRVQMVRPG